MKTAAPSAQAPVFVIPEGVRRLRGGIFGDCKGLRTVVFPSTIEEVVGDPFAGCDSLREVRIPAPVYVRFADAAWMKRIEDLVDVPQDTVVDVAPEAPKAEVASHEEFVPLDIPRVEQPAEPVQRSNPLRRFATAAVEKTRQAREAIRPSAMDWRRAPDKGADLPSADLEGEAVADFDETAPAGFNDGPTADYGDAAPSEFAAEALAPEDLPDDAAFQRGAERPWSEERAGTPKEAEIEQLNAEIRRLEDERDDIKGLFSGMKRKKLQQEIIALKQQIDILQDNELREEGILEDDLLLGEGEGLFPAAPDDAPLYGPEDAALEEMPADGEGLFPAAPDDAPLYGPEDAALEEMPADGAGLFPAAPDDEPLYDADGADLEDALMDDAPDEPPMDDKPRGMPWVRRNSNVRTDGRRQ